MALLGVSGTNKNNNFGFFYRFFLYSVLIVVVLAVLSQKIRHLFISIHIFSINFVNSFRIFRKKL